MIAWVIVISVLVAFALYLIGAWIGIFVLSIGFGRLLLHVARRRWR